MKKIKKCAILVGGGPAPGINSVIRASAIKLMNSGVSVVGVYDGFEHIMKGDISQISEFKIHDVSDIHHQGGSILRTSRANPSKTPKELKNVLNSLKKLKVDALITIGGDDTCYSAIQLEKISKGKIHFVHIPKTIDNDLNLPYGIRTFGFATARHFGVIITNSIINDAKTTSRWYLLTAMGRKAGHLALGIGKASGATLTIIPEEFPRKEISLQHIIDILIGAVIKRKASGRNYGVAILAEGLAERLSPYELKKMGKIEYDAHGHIRLAEIDLGGMLKDELKSGLKEFGLSTTIVDKDLGYELRSVSPTPFDIEYTNDLGYSAAVYLIKGNSGDMASVQNGKFVPISFKDTIDPKTGKTKIRMVDITTESYEVAREYMIRLKEIDFTDKKKLRKLAKTADLTPKKFVKRFGYLVGL
ncbi:MAG: diphosphate--fructose-6-phosphate 1-phosphotransferase [Nitrospinota bacterium]